MIFEKFCGSFVRLRAHNCESSHCVADVFNPARGNFLRFAQRPTHCYDGRLVLFDPAFPGSDALLRLFCRSASGRAFQAAILGLVLLPRKTARNVLFVVMMLILSFTGVL